MHEAQGRLASVFLLVVFGCVLDFFLKDFMRVVEQQYSCVHVLILSRSRPSPRRAAGRGSWFRLVDNKDCPACCLFVLSGNKNHAGIPDLMDKLSRLLQRLVKVSVFVAKFEFVHRLSLSPRVRGAPPPMSSQEDTGGRQGGLQQLSFGDVLLFFGFRLHAEIMLHDNRGGVCVALDDGMLDDIIQLLFRQFA